MKVIYTDEALADLDGILAFIASNYPSIYDAFQSRLRSVIARIGDWPESAQEVTDRPGVRVAPLIRYPYKVFYRSTARNTLHPPRRTKRTRLSVDAGAPGLQLG